MKAVCIIALLVISSPAFAETPAENQSVPAQDQKPFIWDAVAATRCQLPSDHTRHSTEIPLCGPLSSKPPVASPETKPAPKPGSDIG
jgi:hypothetical protein